MTNHDKVKNSDEISQSENAEVISGKAKQRGRGQRPQGRPLRPPDDVLELDKWLGGQEGETGDINPDR